MRFTQTCGWKSIFLHTEKGEAIQVSKIYKVYKPVFLKGTLLCKTFLANVTVKWKITSM